MAIEWSDKETSDAMLAGGEAKPSRDGFKRVMSRAVFLFLARASGQVKEDGAAVRRGLAVKLLTDADAVFQVRGEEAIPRLSALAQDRETMRQGMLDAADTVSRLKQEAESLRAQLPEGMKHCTILFKECDKGHGWLTATNWVQHGCPTCESASLRARVAELEERLGEIDAKRA